MKLPNGFGTVYRLQGNRRRPYVVKKTIQHRQKALGYFETFEDAMAYLVEYNRDHACIALRLTCHFDFARFDRAVKPL